jgi:hypothetical protein
VRSRGAKRIKGCMARIVRNYSTFGKRNDLRLTLSSSTNALSFSSARTSFQATVGQPHTETIAIGPLIRNKHASLESLERLCRRCLLRRRRSAKKSNCNRERGPHHRGLFISVCHCRVENQKGLTPSCSGPHDVCFALSLRADSSRWENCERTVRSRQ